MSLNKTHINQYCTWSILSRYLEKDVFIYILLAITLTLVLDPAHLHNDIIDMDEIWNYQMARRILYGQIPYKDFAILQTPFAPQLNAILLKTFGDHLIVMRWAASIVAVLSGLVAYRILRLTGRSQLLAIVYTFLIVGLFIAYPKNNYSWYVVFFLSVALLLELIKIHAEKPRQVGYEIWIGIVLGLTVITKQNIGLAAIFVSVAYLLVCNNDLGKRNVLKSLQLKATGVLFVVGAELTYLSMHMNIIWLFRDMAENLTRFAGNASIPYHTLLYYCFLLGDIPSLLFALILPTCIFIFIFKALRTKKPMTRRILNLISVYALANICMIVPLSDPVHLLFGMPISIIAVSTAFTKPAEESQKKKIFLSVFLMLIIIFFVPYRFLSASEPTGHDIRHYESIHFSAETKASLIEMNSFIENEEANGRTVLFLNYLSAFYLIPMDKFDYKYDTIGSGGYAEQEMIDLLASKPNATVIIRSYERKENWQETKRIEEYVRETMHYSNSLYGFDVYTK